MIGFRERTEVTVDPVEDVAHYDPCNGNDICTDRACPNPARVRVLQDCPAHGARVRRYCLECAATMERDRLGCGPCRREGRPNVPLRLVVIDQ